MRSRSGRRGPRTSPAGPRTPTPGESGGPASCARRIELRALSLAAAIFEKRVGPGRSASPWSRSPECDENVAERERVALLLVDANDVDSRTATARAATSRRPSARTPPSRIRHEPVLAAACRDRRPSAPEMVSADSRFATSSNLAPFDDLVAQRDGRCPRRGRVGRGDELGNRDDGKHRATRPLELGLVLVEVRSEVGVGDRLGGRRIGRRRERDVADLRAVVLIPPRAPELGIGHVDARRDLIEQLLARNLATIVLLQLISSPPWRACGLARSRWYFSGSNRPSVCSSGALVIQGGGAYRANSRTSSSVTTMPRLRYS